MKTVTEKHILYSKRNFYIEGQEERLGIYSGEQREKHFKQSIINPAKQKPEGRNQSCGNGGVLLPDLLSISSVCFLLIPRTNCQGNSTTHSGLHLSHQLLIKKINCHLTLKQRKSMPFTTCKLNLR